MKAASGRYSWYFVFFILGGFGGLETCARGEIVTHMNMTIPSLVMGNSGTFSGSQITGPVGTTSGTIMHSFAGVEQFIQTSGTGRYSTSNGTTVYGVGYDSFQVLQSIISNTFFTVVNSNATCPASDTTYSWLMIRLRTPDAPRGAMSVANPGTTIGGTFNYNHTTSAFTSANTFNLQDLTLNSSPTLGVSGFSGTPCASGKMLGVSSGVSSFDQYLFAFFGANSFAFATDFGNSQIMLGVPQQTLTVGSLSALSNFVFTGLYTYFQNKTTQTRMNVYLYPDAAGTTYSIKQATSLTDPTQFTTIGTLTCTSINSPTTGFCSGTLQLVALPGKTGNAACLVSPSGTENLLFCSAQYPSLAPKTNAVTIIAKTVNQAVVGVTVPAVAPNVTTVGATTTITATVQNLSSRYSTFIGNPSTPALQLAPPWSDVNAFGGGNGTCGTVLAAYSSCWFNVTYTASGYGANAGTLRVNYDNGTGTNPNATATLVATTGLTSVTLTPNINAAVNGTTTQMVATAHFSDGSTQDVSSIVNWGSSTPGVGGITNAGLVSWNSLGSTTITATLGTQSASETISSVILPVLTVATTQNFPSLYLDQGGTYTFDFNNISGGSPGNDTNMTYTCLYDKVVDGAVASGSPCSNLPGTFSFGATTGILSWTPNTGAWGPYEIMITGTLMGSVSVSEIYVIDVRPGYTLTNILGSYEAQFANFTSNYTTANANWQDLTGNSHTGVTSSTSNATWIGAGTAASPYQLALNGSAYVDFGSAMTTTPTKMMFTSWVSPSSASSLDKVILGTSNDGTGNGFTFRQSKTFASRYDLSVGAEGYNGNILALAPTAYYRLNESSGTTLNDSSGNGYNLTMTGAGFALSQTGAIKNDSDTSVNFTGTARACNITTNTLSGTFSVEAWVNPATASGTLGVMGSVSPGAKSFDLNYIGGKFQADIGTGAAWLTNAASTATKYTTLNAWYHVVYVVTPTGYTIYVDGANAGSGSWASATPLLFDTTHSLCVASNGANTNRFNGKIDEVAVYNTALTPTQVSLHYNIGRTYMTTIVGDLPTSYYRMGETSGTTLADATPNAYNMTLGGSGTTLNQTGAISGDTNGAVQFNGSGYACRTSAFTSLTTTFSVEAWVYPSTITGLLGIVGSRASSDNSFDMKVFNGFIHGDIGTGSAWLSTAADAPTALTANTWYHVVYTVTATGYTIYINGNSVASGTWASATPVLFDISHNLCIGADSTGLFEPFMGKIDEVAIYNYALTPTQVSTHYATGTTSSSAAFCSTASSFTNGQWSAIGGIYDGTNLSLFVNGRQECTMSVGQSVASPLTNLLMGEAAGGTKLWTGSVAELQMYGATSGTVGTTSNVKNNFDVTADLFRLTPVGSVLNGLQILFDPANASSGLAFPGVGNTTTTLFDLSSNSNDGTLNSFVAPNSQFSGTGTAASPYALLFDGTASYVSTSYVQTAVTAYTVEAWINTTDSGIERTIVTDRGAAGTGQSLTFGIGQSGGGHGTAGTVSFEVDSNSLDIGVSSTTAVNDGNWHHIVGTWAAGSGTAVAASQFNIYIDDTLQTVTSGTIGSATSPLTGLLGTSIGFHSPWNTYYKGYLGKVAIYNRVLSAAEIKQNCLASVARYATAVCH